jgi:DNA-binding CsgD family transcriptional regulator
VLSRDDEALNVPATTHDRRERTASLALAALFAAVAVLAGVDLLLDVGEGTTVAHVVTEGAIVVVGLAGASWAARRALSLAREAQGLREQTQELIAGLSAAIDRQLDRWELSPAEKEIALLLLKGLSHKEIAALREVGETTVRQQARAIYRKAGLEGRHDLAAFFLEDLLGPRDQGSPGAASSTR